jgi:hypothetical protein
MDFEPQFYKVVDSLVVVQDGSHLLVYRDGTTHTVTQYWPEKWTVSGSTLAYVDNNNNVVTWHDGRAVIALRGGPFDQLELQRGLVLARRGSTWKVWWRNEVFTF